MLEKAIVFLTKEPIIGKVKTRLGKDIGMPKACHIHEILCKWCVESVKELPYPIILCLDGNPNGRFAQYFVQQGITIIPQHSGTLGERIHQAMQLANRVAILGTDTPHFNPLDIAISLRTSDISIGPAQDGGFWLFAASRPSSDIFAQIPWSTEKVLEKTLANLHHNRLEYSFLPTLQDIDTIDDLQSLLTSPSFPPILKEHLKNYA